MRTTYKVWAGIAAGVFCLVAAYELSRASSTDPSPRAGGVIPTATGPTGTAAPVGELVTVTKVVDGDSIEVTGGRKVRFLGIDACEMGTGGGREAKAYLEVFVGVGQQVRLVADGARDRDDYDRLLRRVERDSGDAGQDDPYLNDIGASIVAHPAVGIYTGKNDAGAAYLARLLASDDGGRDCSGTRP